MPQAEQCMPKSMAAQCTIALTEDRILQTLRVHDNALRVLKVSRPSKPSRVSVAHHKLSFQLLEG